MCLCIQPYRHNTTRFLDETPPDEPGYHKEERIRKGANFLTDNLGLTYVEVRNCDLERFSAK